MAVGDFFHLHYADEAELALARAPDNPVLGKRLRSGGLIADWPGLHFELDDGLLVDYLANSYAFRLCSERLRDVIELGRDQSDVLQWLPTAVKQPDGKELSYWVLHFPEVPRVIDVSKSVMAGPMIIKARLDAKLVDGHRVFSFPNEDLRLIVAGEIKDSIERADCTGMKFSKVPMA